MRGHVLDEFTDRRLSKAVDDYNAGRIDVEALLCSFQRTGIKNWVRLFAFFQPKGIFYHDSYGARSDEALTLKSWGMEVLVRDRAGTLIRVPSTAGRKGRPST